MIVTILKPQPLEKHHMVMGTMAHSFPYFLALILKIMVSPHFARPKGNGGDDLPLGLAVERPNYIGSLGGIEIQRCVLSHLGPERSARKSHRESKDLNREATALGFIFYLFSNSEIKQANMTINK